VESRAISGSWRNNPSYSRNRQKVTVKKPAQ
jgi:hypothetical protein